MGCPEFDLKVRGKDRMHSHLGVPGEHNILNALAACAFADAVGAEETAVSKALNTFEGTDRRFQKKGTILN